MTLLIDPPNAHGHGRVWSHLARDTSYAELHRFAQSLGIPQRGFELMTEHGCREGPRQDADRRC